MWSSGSLYFGGTGWVVRRKEKESTSVNTFRKWARGIKNIQQGKLLESHKGKGLSGGDIEVSLKRWEAGSCEKLRHGVDSRQQERSEH